MGTDEWIWRSALSPAKGVYPNSGFGNWAEICVGRFPGSLLDVAPGVKSFVVQFRFPQISISSIRILFAGAFLRCGGDARSSNKGIEKKRRGSGFFFFVLRS